MNTFLSFKNAICVRQFKPAAFIWPMQARNFNSSRDNVPEALPEPNRLYNYTNYGHVPMNISEIISHRRVTNGYRLKARLTISEKHVGEFRASELARTAAGLLQEYAASRRVYAFAKYCSPLIREELQRVEKLSKRQAKKERKRMEKQMREQREQRMREQAEIAGSECEV